MTACFLNALPDENCHLGGGGGGGSTLKIHFCRTATENFWCLATSAESRRCPSQRLHLMHLVSQGNLLGFLVLSSFASKVQLRPAIELVIRPSECKIWTPCKRQQMARLSRNLRQKWKGQFIQRLQMWRIDTVVRSGYLISHYHHILAVVAFGGHLYPYGLQTASEAKCSRPWKC